MRILIVAATPVEFRAPRSSSPHRMDVLTTGVGMVAAAARTARALAGSTYDLALNFGVCGSFDRALPPGTVVHVVSDRIAELGAEDDEAFLTIEEMSLPADPVFANPAPPANAALRQLPIVTGITVNTVHGRQSSIDEAVRRFNPQVESMEGAGFMCACLISGVPFAQVRAVSNFVERRHREAWKMDEAIGNLGRVASWILESL
jgi:futalosine hydrolase